MKGYKKTEIGIIPEDWDVKRLGEKCDFFSGGTPTTANSEYYGREIPFITSSDLNSIKIRNVNLFITKKGLIFSSAKIVKKGSLLLALYGATAGVVAITEIEGAINQAILCINSKIFDKAYLFYWFEDNRDKIITKYTQGGQPNLNSHIIKNILIPFPPLLEQKAIAKVLSDIDSLIENLDKLIQKKKLIKKGVMQELLTGKKRLPGFKSEWVMKKLGTMGYTYGGLTGKKKNDFGIGNSYYIPFLNILMNVKVDIKDLEKVDIKANENQNKVKKGDLFFNTSSETPEEVGMCAVLTEELENTYLNSFCFGYRLKDKSIDGLFLSYLINSEIGRKMFANIAQGATRYNLSKKHFDKIEILIPPTLEEQKAIAKILSDMDADIESLERKKEKYEKIKKGAMELLLSGKVRLRKGND